MAELDEHTAPGQIDRVRDSPGETLLCMLMAPGACKICRRCNVLQVPIQIIPLGIPKWGAIPSLEDKNCDGMSPDHP